MAEKIVYSALPKEDMDNIFDIMEALAKLMDQMSYDAGVSSATRKSALQASDSIRIKILDFRTKVQDL
jgi:hypothetical protein